MVGSAHLYKIWSSTRVLQLVLGRVSLELMRIIR